jgi:hypothetical protein
LFAVEEIPPLLDRLIRSESPHGVVASFQGESEPSDFGGACWELLITDGIFTGFIEVELSGDWGRDGVDLEPDLIEEAAEELAVHFPIEGRAACMVAWCEHVGPLPLQPEFTNG